MDGHRGLFAPKPCADCGSDPVNHTLTRWSIGLESVLDIFAITGETVSRIAPSISVDRVLDVALRGLFQTMIALRLGKQTYDVDDLDFKFVTHVMWAEAKRRGIDMVQFRPFNVPKHLFIAKHGGTTLVFDRLPVPKGSSRGVSWIDDKAILKKELLKRGLPVSKGEARASEAGALKLFRQLRKPVIVKPHQGSGTRHTTLHITDEKELIRAFRIAKRISPWVMIEEELVGPVFRPTVINGKLVATIERTPPTIIGDGKSTVAQLIEQENKHPQRQGPVFSHIKITPQLTTELTRQNLTLESIPEAGRRIELHQKINWSVGGRTKDVTDIVHPDNVALFEEIAALLKAPIVGLDFIIKDISRSWKEQEMCGVIEANSMPFIDTHHFPFEGEPRDVASAIWDMAFPTSK
jgi:D-alanine-D-alanine ligase-like ATP-grasp enzyme